MYVIVLNTKELKFYDIDCGWSKYMPDAMFFDTKGQAQEELLTFDEPWQSVCDIIKI